VVSHTQHPVGDRVPSSRCWCAARLLFDRCTTAPETRPLLAISRVQRRPTVIPRPVVRGPLCFPGHAPPYPPPGRFGRATADYVDRPKAALGSRHQPGTALGPAGDHPSPPSPPARRRSRSNHAGKSSYSGEIDYRFLTFQTGYRFSGSRLTSLK